MKFMPDLGQKSMVIRNGQKCIDKDVSNGSYKEKIKHGSKILSILTSWAFEDSIDTTDSMKARGYGLSGRTSYSNFRFDSRDGMISGIILMLVAIIIYGEVNNALYFECYPTFAVGDQSVLGNITIVAYGILSFLPSILAIMEEIKWKHIESKI